MKRVFATVLVLALVFALVGCGGTANKEPEPAVDETFKVGLLLPGSINDGGWNATGYAGLKAIEATHGAEISYVETPNPGDMKDSYIDYAERGYDLIIGHSFAYSDVAAEIAPDYPNTIFTTSGGTKTAPNLAPFLIGSEEPSYLAGVIAAYMSKTGKAGFIGGTEIPSIAKTGVAFELGAKSVNPDFEVLHTFVGNLTDVNAGYEAALAHIKAGADVILANANAVELGVFKAINEEGVYIFGMSTDKSELSPDYCIASVMLYNDRSFLEMARQVLEGDFKGVPQQVGIKAGVVELKWNEKIKDRIPREALDAVEKATQKIVSGELKIPGDLDL